MAAESAHVYRKSACGAAGGRKSRKVRNFLQLFEISSCAENEEFHSTFSFFGRLWPKDLYFKGFEMLPGALQ